MAMSDKIEAFIIELLKEASSDGLELGRNELAGIFNCVPSQINYVISTRFTPEKGYCIESRRGGGGYIRIKKSDKLFIEDIDGILKKLKNDISEEKAEKIIKYLSDTGRIDDRQKKIMEAALLGGMLENIKDGDILRAKILKNMITQIMKG